MHRGDGDGWVRCDRDHVHWGRYGAAGLLVRHDDPVGTRWVMLGLRAGWTHGGGTWGLPGGAIDSHEDPVSAALREAREEFGLDPTLVRTGGTWVDDHGGWSYTTVLASLADRLPLAPANPEHEEVAWFTCEQAARLPLHVGLAASWPSLAML